MSKPTKALPVNVYRTGDRQTFHNGYGIPAEADTVLLLVHGGIFEPKEGDVVLEVVDRNIGGKSVPFARIVGSSDAQGHWMMGGTYVGSSDSRVRDAIGFYGALPVHDRMELWK